MATLTNEQRVWNLTEELIQTKQQKKDSSRAFNEEIKRLQAEIEELISGDEKEVKVNPEE